MEELQQQDKNAVSTSDSGSSYRRRTSAGSGSGSGPPSRPASSSRTSLNRGGGFAGIGGWFAPFKKLLETPPVQVAPRYGEPNQAGRPGPALCIAMERISTNHQRKQRQPKASRTAARSGSGSATGGVIGGGRNMIPPPFAASPPSTSTMTVPTATTCSSGGDQPGVVVVTPSAVDRYHLNGAPSKRTAFPESVSALCTANVAGVGRVFVCATQCGRVFVVKADLLDSMLILDTHCKSQTPLFKHLAWRPPPATRLERPRDSVSPVASGRQGQSVEDIETTHSGSSSGGAAAAVVNRTSRPAARRPSITLSLKLLLSSSSGGDSTPQAAGGRRNSSSKKSDAENDGQFDSPPAAVAGTRELKKKKSVEVVARGSRHGSRASMHRNRAAAPEKQQVDWSPSDASLRASGAESPTLDLPSPFTLDAAAVNSSSDSLPTESFSDSVPVSPPHPSVSVAHQEYADERQQRLWAAVGGTSEASEADHSEHPRRCVTPEWRLTEDPQSPFTEDLRKTTTTTPFSNSPSLQQSCSENDLMKSEAIPNGVVSVSPSGSLPHSQAFSPGSLSRAECPPGSPAGGDTRDTTELDSVQCGDFLRNEAGGSTAAAPPPPLYDAAPVTAVTVQLSFANVARAVIGGTMEGLVFIWEVPSGQLLKIIDFPLSEASELLNEEELKRNDPTDAEAAAVVQDGADKKTIVAQDGTDIMHLVDEIGEEGWSSVTPSSGAGHVVAECNGALENDKTSLSQPSSPVQRTKKKVASPSYVGALAVTYRDRLHGAAQLWVGYGNGFISVFDLETHKVRKVMRAPNNKPIAGLEAAPQLGIVIALGGNSHLSMWRASDLYCLRVYPAELLTCGVPLSFLKVVETVVGDSRHAGGARSSSVLFTGCTDGSIVVRRLCWKHVGGDVKSSIEGLSDLSFSEQTGVSRSSSSPLSRLGSAFGFPPSLSSSASKSRDVLAPSNSREDLSTSLHSRLAGGHNSTCASGAPDGYEIACILLRTIKKTKEPKCPITAIMVNDELDVAFVGDASGVVSTIVSIRYLLEARDISDVNEALLHRQKSKITSGSTSFAA